MSTIPSAFRSTRPSPRLAGAVLGLCVPAAGALAQDLLSLRPQPPARAAKADELKGAAQEIRYYQPGWTVQVEALEWFVAPGGFVQLPGGTNIQWFKTFNNDSPHLSPYGEVNVREGDWRLGLSGAMFSARDRTSVQGGAGQIGGVPFASGDPARVSLDFATFQAEAAYRLPISARDKGKSPSFFATWEAVAGARFFDIDTEFSLPAGRAEGHGFFGAPYIGVRVAFEMAHGFSMDVAGNVGIFSDGGDTKAYTTDIAAAFVWRPVDHVGVELGYRQVAFDLKSGKGTGEFNWDGAMAGLFAGVVIRF